jgi:methionyl-tRNA formyltransferase
MPAKRTGLFLLFDSCLLIFVLAPVRLIFLGTPSFAVPSLERLVASGHEVLAVYTQPDRPKGRGRGLAASPVKEAAIRLGLPVYQPERIRGPEVVESLASFGARAMVVVGYGQILPQSVIDIPPLGIINVHASLLPKYRGAAPIQWSIVRGETTTGVTTMRIDAGMDTGDILLQRETPIAPEETAIDLGQRLAAMGADLLAETLEAIERRSIVPRAQDHSLASYAPILRKEDGEIDWNLPAIDIYNRVRGFLPWPGAWTRFRGQMMHVWRARLPAEAVSIAPGVMQPEKRRLVVGCGARSSLELLEVQIEGRKRITAEAFLNGQRLLENEPLGE